VCVPPSQVGQASSPMIQCPSHRGGCGKIDDMWQILMGATEPSTSPRTFCAMPPSLSACFLTGTHLWARRQGDVKWSLIPVAGQKAVCGVFTEMVNRSACIIIDGHMHKDVAAHADEHSLREPGEATLLRNRTATSMPREVLDIY
jgi:hypothetical protein